MNKYIYKWRELWKLYSVKALVASIVTDVISGLMFFWQPSTLWMLPIWFTVRSALGVLTIYLRNIKQ